MFKDLFKQFVDSVGRYFIPVYPGHNLRVERDKDGYLRASFKEVLNECDKIEDSRIIEFLLNKARKNYDKISGQKQDLESLISKLEEMFETQSIAQFKEVCSKMNKDKIRAIAEELLK